MNAPARQFCPLCRGELGMPDAVRPHLIADHKRSAAEADELIARFDAVQPIPDPAPEPTMCCATAKLDSGSERLGRERAAALERPVN